MYKLLDIMQPSTVMVVRSTGYNLCKVDVCAFSSYKKYSYSTVGDGCLTVHLNTDETMISEN